MKKIESLSRFEAKIQNIALSKPLLFDCQYVGPEYSPDYIPAGVKGYVKEVLPANGSSMSISEAVSMIGEWIYIDPCFDYGFDNGAYIVGSDRTIRESFDEDKEELLPLNYLATVYASKFQRQSRLLYGKVLFIPVEYTFKGNSEASKEIRDKIFNTK
jgi:hypothetical protein